MIFSIYFYYTSSYCQILDYCVKKRQNSFLVKIFEKFLTFFQKTIDKYIFLYYTIYS